MKRFGVVCGFAVIFAVSALTTTAVSAPDTSPDTSLCSEVATPPAKSVHLRKPTKRLNRKKRYKVVFNTSCGEFTVRLAVSGSPKTAASVKYMVDKGVYDNTAFHRVVPEFVVQGGDPRGDGTGDAGYSIHERPRRSQRYRINTFAMAKAGNQPRGTSGSQFFVCTGTACTDLPLDSAIAGQVITGADTIGRIDALGNADDEFGRPVRPVVVFSAHSVVY